MRKSGVWDKSELYYGKALALNPRHEQAMEYLGEMYLETGRPELARTMLDKLATLCPEGCEARSELEVRSEEHTSELQSLMRISYAVFCLKKKTNLSYNVTTKIEHHNKTPYYNTCIINMHIFFSTYAN